LVDDGQIAYFGKVNNQDEITVNELQEIRYKLLKEDETGLFKPIQFTELMEVDFKSFIKTNTHYIYIVKIGNVYALVKVKASQSNEFIVTSDTEVLVFNKNNHYQEPSFTTITANDLWVLSDKNKIAASDIS
jgi:hypothetical protein